MAAVDEWSVAKEDDVAKRAMDDVQKVRGVGVDVDVDVDVDRDDRRGLMTWGRSERLEGVQVRHEAESDAQLQIWREQVGDDVRQWPVNEEQQEGMLEIASAAWLSNGNVAWSVANARRAAAMDVVPAWAMVWREGPVADVAPPLGQRRG